MRDIKRTERKSNEMAMCIKNCGLVGPSHGIAKHDILLGQLQQHGIVKELVDAHILTQALDGGGGGNQT